MPVQGNYGTDGNPWELWSDFWQYTPLTSDPASPTEGDMWLRTDLNSGDKISTVRFRHASGTWDIPVFASGATAERGTVKVLQIQTPNGEGFIPLREGRGEFKQLGFQHGGARYGVHNAGVVPTNGVSRWTFDDLDTSGGQALDVWGSNDGTIDGATTGVSGASQTYNTAEAYSFDGSNDRVELPDLGLSSGSSFSVALWVNIDTLPSSTGNSQTPFGRFDGADDIINVTAASSDDWQFRLGHVGGNTLEARTTSGSSVEASWQHIVVVFDASGPSAEIYKDGSSIGTDSGTVDNFATTNGPWIGARSDSAEWVPGDIDDVRVYNKVLSSTEVSNLSNNGIIS